LPGPSFAARSLPPLLIGGHETSCARAEARHSRISLRLHVAGSRQRADRPRVALHGAAPRFGALVLIDVFKARAQARHRCGLRMRKCGRKHGCAGAGQRKTMWNGTPHENILAPQARLMVNGCKTRMVNGALRSPSRRFPC
jgi:hypothetical protein